MITAVILPAFSIARPELREFVDRRFSSHDFGLIRSFRLNRTFRASWTIHPLVQDGILGYARQPKHRDSLFERDFRAH
jgi:hypothetical protein